MAWTYDASDLGTGTASARLNTVRLLVGDTDTSDQQLQNEEVNFALSQANDNVYYAASFCASNIASKYARRVTTDIDSALRVEYSDLATNYKKLAIDLKSQGQRYLGTSLGVYAGGITQSGIDAVRDLTDRVTPSFRRDRFRNQTDDYLRDWEDDS